MTTNRRPHWSPSAKCDAPLDVPADGTAVACPDCTARETVIALLCAEVEALKAERMRLEIELAARGALREGVEA